MNTLGFDTVSTTFSIALKTDDGIHEVNMPYVRDHNVILIPELEALLNKAGVTIADINQVALGIGPGSFTALRISLATVKAMCYARKIPVYGVSSLKALAENILIDEYGEHTKAAIIDAKKNALYADIYRGTELIHEGLDITKDALVDLLRDEPKLVIAGDGFTSNADYFREHLPNLTTPADDAHIIRARKVIDLAATRALNDAPDNILGLLPVYIRMSEAEYNKRKREGTL